MGQPERSSRETNTYILDSENATEMARLMLQDRLLNAMMGGSFPERERTGLDGIHSILDIGCGPGGWALDVACTYQHIEVIGIDISETMIAYARKQVELHNLSNLRFELVNALQERAYFPDERFDLINIRAAIGYVPRTEWPRLVQDCFRMTRPGGILRITESDRGMMTDSSAFEEYLGFCSQLFTARGYGFSPDGCTFAITPVLGQLLERAGYRKITLKPYVLDFSYGTPFHASQVQNAAVAFKALQPLLLGQGLTTQEKLESLYEDMLRDMEKSDFNAIMYLITICGEKPPNV